MTSKEIENNVIRIFDDFSEDEFIFDLLIAFGISKTSVTRLKKGDFNLSKIDGEILYKRKIFFKTSDSDKLLSEIENITIEERITKHSPRFAIFTDYKTLVAKDLKLKKNLDIKITELPKYFDFFLPLAGSEVYNTNNDNKADREAAYKMAQLYDNLVHANETIYKSKESIHGLNILLSRLLFCYFAEDTEIFEEESIFTNTLAQHTSDDGFDTHEFLTRLFERLNTKDSSNFPVWLQKFPYVNGGLFQDTFNIPHFTFKARKILIELGELNWKDINPDIFGSMIQAVVLPEYRSDLGMHYTSIENILKLIKPLFLDELYEEFDKNIDNPKRLEELIIRISKMKFFDPACGSGNFLIITYKEIRKLEIDILKRIIELTESKLLIAESEISIDQFNGIEIDDFAHEMAILSLWLAEHQMNQYFDQQLDGYTEPKSIIPLKRSAQIHLGNATRREWNDICPISSEDEVYIIGNPPYLGYSRQDDEQKADMEITFKGNNNYKKLDYISCWFFKASDFIKNKKSKCAFVTTNSITQGEQVALIWPLILNKGQEIFFAYQSFKWTNNAKGNAGVAVVIIGLRNNDNTDKFIYSGNIRQKVKNISPYLTNTNNAFVVNRNTPISRFPLMVKGSSPNDNGNLLLDNIEMLDITTKNENAKKFIKKYIGASEFINRTHRFCIYVPLGSQNEACSINEFKNKFDNVEIFRINSRKKATREKAKIPYFFDEDKYQQSEFLLVPQTGSERREYIPAGYFDDSYLPSNGTRVVYNSEPWLFGVVSSRMHIVWVRAVAGRLKTDMQYSNTLCYNTFPFPEINLKQKENLNLYVFAILDERAKYPEKTMAQLYNPNTMPKGLKQAHRELDDAIEKCYRLQPFTTDTERLEYLFKLYEEMLKKDTLFVKQKKKEQ